MDAGADDYITKPFDISELMARIRAIAKKAGYPQRSGYPKLQRAAAGTRKTDTILAKRRGLTLLNGNKDGGSLLKKCRKNPAQSLSYKFCVGGNSDINENNLDNYIYFLRKRLRQLKVDVAIKTMHGVGYYME